MSEKFTYTWSGGQKKEKKSFQLLTTVTFLSLLPPSPHLRETNTQSEVNQKRSASKAGNASAGGRRVPVLIAELASARRNVTITHGRSAGSIYFTLRLILQE